MKNLKDLTKSKLTRRSFLQGLATTGATATLAGCSSDDGGALMMGGTSGSGVEPDYNGNSEEFQKIYGMAGHNCAGRCLSVANVKNGKIVRILTDESKSTSDGTYLDRESRNFPQTRNCPKCRSYRYRIYHPGRLLYPLKQTKKRGDLTGFKRISWEQALAEIAQKHKNVLDKYGSDGIYSLYANGSSSSPLQGGTWGPLGGGTVDHHRGSALRYMGGIKSIYFGTYSLHQHVYCGTGYTGMEYGLNNNDVAKFANKLMLWGNNTLSTLNYSSYGYIKGVEDLKKIRPDAKVHYVGPYFSDSGVVLADEWHVSKPFTDPALIAGMLYHMLDNTFDLTNGTLKPNPWLDVDYLDTLVYGFFDSPTYSLTEADGTIATAEATVSAGKRNVPAVESGQSYASWILGNNGNAPAYSATATNYTAKKYEEVSGGFKRWAPCSFANPNGANSAYKTKKDFLVPKTPKWASDITGIPEESIKELAKMFATEGPVMSVWAAAVQKQSEGVVNLIAIQALHVITKNVGKYGAGYTWDVANSTTQDPKAILPTWGNINIPRTWDLGNGVIPLHQRADASCTAWHTALKMAFAQELKDNGYQPTKYIPNFKPTDQDPKNNIYWDDAGTKTFVQWKRDLSTGNILTYKDKDGNDFYDWVGRTGTAGTDNAHQGTPVYSGIRLMYNTGGNIFMNQHENTNDSRQMIEALKLNNGDADTFCLVSFDNFMTATPRWSDYVLPGTTYWEQQDVISPYAGSAVYTTIASTPQGETKATYDFANELLKAYEIVDPTVKGAATDFTGGVKDKPIEAFIREAHVAASKDDTSPYYNTTWDEFLQIYLPSKPNNDAITEPARKAVIDAYDNLSAATKANDPFIKTGNLIDTNEVSSGGYGNEFFNADNAPKSSLKFHVSSPVLKWQYENRFSKFHGYLPAEQRGQQHKDSEGNDIVLSIPLYYAYEDYFMEAYGGAERLNELKYLLTTTHDKYRVHSSLAENPLLRELTHRVPGQDSKGKFKKANDYNHFATVPNAFAVQATGTFSAPNSTINADGTVDQANKEIASYSEIYMNKSDAESNGIKDGDLLEVSNPIGTVRVVARLTERCAKGYVDLHQGNWYDPREIGDKTVDVGGCANTLMASQPSRIDHGNAQQSAMVKITKVENY